MPSNLLKYDLFYPFRCYVKAMIKLVRNSRQREMAFSAIRQMAYDEYPLNF